MKITTLFIIFLIFISISLADFRLEKYDVNIYDINKDGSARVQEVVTFLIVGDLSYSLYDSGLYNNDLSFWASTTQLKEIKLHVGLNKIEIQDFRLRPQPRKSCNSFANSCRGQLIIDYKALPYYYSNGDVVNGTGLFFITKEKPRTTDFSVNPKALSFTTTSIGDIIIDKYITLRITLPQGGLVTELNPFPENLEAKLPQSPKELSWSDTILVRFVLNFQVEDSLGKEVTDFFGDSIKYIEKLLKGEYGFSVMLIVVILIGGYIYLYNLKYKKDK